MRRFRRVARRWIYRQRCLAKTVSFVGKSIGRVPQTNSLPEKSKKMVTSFSSLPSNSLRTTVCKKQTQETRNHTKPQLTRRVQLVCNTTDYLSYTYPTTTTTIPYIKGKSENISRNLQPFNIRIAHKPTTTLGQLQTNTKRNSARNRQETVYEINCSDFHASYVGETGRNLTTRLIEHRRATRKGDVNNHVAKHHWLTNHTFDWDSA